MRKLIKTRLMGSTDGKRSEVKLNSVPFLHHLSSNQPPPPPKKIREKGKARKAGNKKILIKNEIT